MQRFVMLAFALALFMPPQGAHAQRRRQPGALPQPFLQSLYPLGVQAGGTIDVNVRGTDLEGINALWFDHPGLCAFHLKGTTFRVVAATGTPVGLHDVRVATTYGVSNPRTLVVSGEPTVTETEPNNTAETANLVTIHTSINGEISAATDVDCFAFVAKKGQRLLFDLDGERRGKPAGRHVAVAGRSGARISRKSRRVRRGPVPRRHDSERRPLCHQGS